MNRPYKRYHLIS